MFATASSPKKILLETIFFPFLAIQSTIPANQTKFSSIKAHWHSTLLNQVVNK